MENEEECKLNQTSQNRGIDTEQGVNVTALVRETRRWGRNKKTRRGRGMIYSSQTTWSLTTVHEFVEISTSNCLVCGIRHLILQET